MRIVNNFILINLAKIFFPIFFVIFFISSVILFIRVASVTAVIKMSFLEFFELYFYTLPVMLFFALPITFFVAAVITLSRLSQEYELPVLFSLGLSSHYLLRFFFPLSLILSATLFIFSFILIPASNQFYQQFLNEKRKNIDINLKPSEFSQKLGSWLVYINSFENNRYGEVVLFSKQSLQGEVFIVADSAELINNHSIFEISVSNGSAYLGKEKMIERIDYEKLITRLNISTNYQHNSIWDYWASMNNAYIERDTLENDRKAREGAKVLRNFATYILVSLFPILSIPLIPLFGVMHPRFMHPYTYFFIIFSVAFFYGCVHIVSTYFPIHGILPTIFLWSIGSYLLFRQFIARFF
ncbi:hypothetical protein CCZ01_06855 [Helicobacter monodelphidis]|uniref:LptF/LptG family permease n=1 Tax=Helicobacter sp. 15-1451 TaxID=2004995 RepID=UPI000DCBE425|nr:LptF/LptG family permease [Helicobacter sp. 15-1451]RAX57178.1 hypothetical protein CCZ01_06855 [Helicobacter sp. 15-1451]